MGSLFDGTDDVNNIRDIYDRMEANCPNPRSTSQKLWKLRCARELSSHNPNPETLLEKAVAMLAARGHLQGWFNQCPTASGINDSSRNRHSNVDLVHWDEANKCARLVELKWESDNPLSALRQILRYGAAYIFCLVHRGQLNFPEESLIEMDTRHVSLEVVAPRRFYNYHNERDCFAQMSKDLDGFAASKTSGTLTMSLDAFAFPDGFQMPFRDGVEVKNECFTQQLSPEVQAVRDAFNNLTPVWPQS